MTTIALKNSSVGRKVKHAQTDRNIIRIAFVLSVVLHLLGFVAAGLTLKWWLIEEKQVDETQEHRPPLVFTLQEMPKPALPPRRDFTLEEMPKSVRQEKPPENPTNLADYYAVAQNPHAPDDLPIGAPFATNSSLGADRHRENLEQLDKSERPNAKTNAQDAISSETSMRPNDHFSSGFRREFLTGDQSSALTNHAEFSAANLQSRAPKIGSFSLDTYDWDFAPYMSQLGKKIQRNIYPPPAFTHMGIISGRATVRFRVSRDGTLLDMELIGYEGHKSLMEASVRAVQLSAPFRALPDDFPKDYLAVTAQFEYIVNR
jgi:outer membrane biosynthesis protein TonB